MLKYDDDYDCDSDGIDDADDNDIESDAMDPTSTVRLTSGE